MNPKYLRYTKSMLCSLGYSCDTLSNHELVNPFPSDSIEEKEIFAYGNFKGIIKTLFADTWTPEFSSILSQNSAPEVLSFVNNFLMRKIESLPSSSSDEVAFNLIIPRSVQSDSELRPYLDNLKQFITESRKQLSNNETTSNN